MNITYFVHGATADNEARRSSGWNDIELSTLGIAQSNELKSLININDFDVVFCSDLRRAVHSAKVVFEDKVQIIEDSRLRECNYGDYNGQLSKIVEPLQEQCIADRFLNGESYEDVKARIQDFLKYLREEYQDKRIAIMAHKAPQLALEVIVNNKTWQQVFDEDWRKTGSWQPGWEYNIK